MAASSEPTTDLSLKTVLKSRTDEDMNLVQNRLSSFEEWPLSGRDCACPGERMAEAGFYHAPTADEPDLTRCQVCFKEMVGWESGDDPVEQHSRSTDCAFISLGKKSDELTVKDFQELEKSRATNRIRKLAELYSANLDDAAREVHREMDKLRKMKR